MKAKKKPLGMKHGLRKKSKRKERIALTVSISIAIILISGSLINSMLNQSSTSQTVASTSEPKAAIVDQLSLTHPNQTFIQTAATILNQSGYTADYYSGEDVTVEFLRSLPTHGYGIVILRVHATASGQRGEEDRSLTAFFTSEQYSTKKYLYEQLTDQLSMTSYSKAEPPFYFGILPKFVTSSMKGKFHNTIIIMMGCEGLKDTKMAEAFIERGAKVYISWNKAVLATHTDQATTQLLRHFLTENQTINEAVTQTNNEMGPDPAYNSLLSYYPLEAGSYTIRSLSNNLATSAIEIKPKVFYERKKPQDYLYSRADLTIESLLFLLCFVCFDSLS